MHSKLNNQYPSFDVLRPKKLSHSFNALYITIKLLKIPSLNYI